MLTKKNTFRLVLISIPFLFLFLLELFLRIFNYGDNLNTLAMIKKDGKDYYTMNQLVGKRYFNEERLYYRKGSHDFFEVNKKPNTVRVFCFGASTTAGFPYEYDAIPSEFLRDRLVDAFPHKNIEVINTAIAATNSYTVCEFVNELSRYKPDLFIVYMGQNEFYGAYGIGSSISIGKSRWLIKTFLWLQNFKTFQLLKNTLSSVASLFKKEEDNEQKILMEQMVKNNSIKFKGSDYNTAVNTFRDNYKEVIATAKEHKIPIIISTLVTNEKDLPPFVSIDSSDLNDSLKNKSNKYYNDGIKLEKESDYENAVHSFDNSLDIDSGAANVHYQLGLCYENLKSFNKAKKQFVIAKNLDGLRFRAPSDFNQIIKQLSHQYNVPLADVNKSFSDSSPNGIIGNELLLDHVHPNLRGYFLLAKTWFQAIKNNNLIGLSPSSIQKDSTIWSLASYTPLDSVIGELKILKLKSRPPFSKNENEFVFKPNNAIENIAYKYLTEDKTSWGIAHIMAAKDYISRNDFKSSLKEYKAVLLTDETNPNLLSMVGDMYYKMKTYSKAESYYSRAFENDDSQFLKYRLGLTYLNLNKPESTIQYLTSCLKDNEYSSNKFTYAEVEDIRYNLAMAYMRTKENSKAVSELELILKANPSNGNARQLLNQLNHK